MKALDLFCGAGGASMGLHRAGFDVTGVDMNPMPDYPFSFIQDDALEYPPDGYTLIWASPPCQAHSRLSGVRKDKEYPDLIASMRERLEKSSSMWVIENVPLAPLRRDLMLCGTMFGLGVYRHRIFEANFPIPQLGHPDHFISVTSSFGAYRAGKEWPYLTVAGHVFRAAEGAAAMGIHWMRRRDDIAEAIPPSYAEYIARAARNPVLPGL